MPRQLWKIIVVGDEKVGKTSFVNRKTRDTFDEAYKATIGADFVSCTVDGNTTMQLWDTAGAERFRSLGAMFFKGANGVIAVFDITNKKSFESLQGHIDRVKAAADSDFGGGVIVGNKSDNAAQREVDGVDAIDFAEQVGMQYIEVSAKDGSAVDVTIDILAQQLAAGSSSTAAAKPAGRAHVDPAANTSSDDESEENSLVPDSKITDADRRGADIRRLIAQELEKCHPVVDAMRKHVDAADAIRTKDAAVLPSAGAADREERRRRRRAAADAAFAELDATLGTVHRPAPDATALPGDVDLTFRVRSSEFDVEAEGSAASTAAAAPDAEPRLTIDTVTVPVSHEVFKDEAKARFAGSEFEGVEALAPRAGFDDSDSDDDGSGQRFRIRGLTTLKYRVSPSASGSELTAVIEALRRAEKEAPGRDDDDESPMFFADFTAEHRDGERFLVVSIGTQDEDPILEKIAGGPTGHFMKHNAHASSLQSFKTRTELPVTAAEWLESDRSYPSLLNRIRFSANVRGSRSNVDHFMAAIGFMLAEVEPEIAVQASRNMAFGRLMDKAQLDFVINPASLAFGRSMRGFARRHRDIVSNHRAHTGYEGSTGDDDDDAREAAMLWGTTAVPELWSRWFTHHFLFGLTGSTVKDLLTYNMVQAYADENEYNDPEDEEMRIVPAFFAACGVIAEFTSLNYTNALFRSEVRFTGLDFPSALPHSLRDAAAEARQVWLSKRRKQQPASNKDDGSASELSEDEDADRQRRVDWSDDIDDSIDQGRSGRVVDREDGFYRGVHIRRFDIDFPAVVQRFAPTTAVRIAVVAEVDTGLNFYKCVAKAVGLPEKQVPYQLDEDEMPDAAVATMSRGLTRFTTADGVRVEAFISKFAAPLIRAAHGVIIVDEVSDKIEDTSSWLPESTVCVALPEVLESTRRIVSHAAGTTEGAAVADVLRSLPQAVRDAATTSPAHPLDGI